MTDKLVNLNVHTFKNKGINFVFKKKSWTTSELVFALKKCAIGISIVRSHVRDSRRKY